MIWNQATVFLAYLFVYVVAFFNPFYGIKAIGTVLLLMLAALYNSQMQVMQWHPRNKPLWYDHPWWTHREDFQNRNWWLNYPFSMFWDGWHYCEYICVYSMISMTAIWLSLVSVWTIFSPLLGYIVWGIIWNTSYDS